MGTTHNKIMSLGHYCFLAETLRDISDEIGYYIRESGGIDWVNNFDGIKGLVRLFGGSLEKNIEHDKWTYDSWWCDLIPCQSVWNMFFPHEDLSNWKDKSKVMKRLQKIRNGYGKEENQYFIYLLKENENRYDCVDYFAKICEQLGILDKMIIVGKSEFIRNYRHYETGIKFSKIWYSDEAYDAYNRSEEDWDKAQASIKSCLEFYHII